MLSEEPDMLSEAEPDMLPEAEPDMFPEAVPGELCEADIPGGLATPFTN